jgi:hypothetical protein
VHNGGIGSEASYPYTAKTSHKCNTVPSVASISGYTDVPTNSPTAMMNALAMQPVAIAIEADQSGFQFYSSGVFTGACGTSLDHGVLATGYGTLNGADYWAVKNSWGASWGSNGYIYLSKSVSQSGGQCGLLMAASYPTKAAAVEETAAAPVGDIWTSCAKKGDKLTNLAVKITPDPPVKGKSVTIAASGTLSETVSSGTIDLVIKVLGIPVINKKIDLCTASKKVTCPIPAGPLSLDVTQAIPSAIPSGQYTGEVTVTDQSGAEITCVDLKLNF